MHNSCSSGTCSQGRSWESTESGKRFIDDFPLGEWAAAVLTSPMEHRGSQLLHPQRTDLRTNVHSLLHLSPFSDSHDGRRRTEKLAMDHSQCTLTLSVTFEGKDASPVPSSLHCLRCPATPAKRTRASVLCWMKAVGDNGRLKSWDSSRCSNC